ncbi:fumarate reductase subunit C [Jiangella aurantiaca]|uniref:Fumarate reductase subunit C n=1 Tax=Jiangella aurantiaca TaxID=2530373 RepID=A0A4R5AJH8_9ACTN|nr:fumarate reductase subunit C [Jiangella aurantiaca]
MPRTYRPRPSIWWWVRKRSYLLFVLRELSSVFVAWFVALTLALVWSVERGAEQYERLLDVLSNPFAVALNVVALAFLLLHTITWFNLTPKAMPIRLFGARVPPVAIVAAQWAAFAAVSAFVIWLVVG